MGIVATQANSNTPVDMGSPLQVQLLAADLQINTSVPASGSSVSETVLNCGYKSFSFSAKSTQNGTISIQRYLDAAGTIPLGAALTGSITANTDTSVTNVDGKPFQSLVITISNSGGSTATLSDVILLLQAN